MARRERRSSGPEQLRDERPEFLHDSSLDQSAFRTPFTSPDLGRNRLVQVNIQTVQGNAESSRSDDGQTIQHPSSTCNSLMQRNSTGQGKNVFSDIYV